jgi:hypothetical protein
MAVFENLLQLMIDTGAYYVFIWLLFAGVVYGLLEKSGILGETSVNAGVSLGSSFFVLLGIFVFAPEGLFLNFAAGLGFALVGIFGAAILMALAGVEISDLGDDIEGNVLAGAGAILIITIFIGSFVLTADFSGVTGFFNDSWEEIGFPIVFLIFLIIIMRTLTDSGSD